MSARRLGLAGVLAAVLVLAIVVTVLVTGEDTPSEAVRAAASTADPVPTGPITTAIPQGCGIRDHTLDRLTPEGEGGEEILDPDRQTCTWETGVIAWSLGGANRRLEVDVHKEHELAGPAGSKVGAAIEDFTRELGQEPGSADGSKAGPVRQLVGLGDEGVTWNHVEVGDPAHSSRYTTILLRSGNVVAKIEYGGSDYGRPGTPTGRPRPLGPLSTKVTYAGAVEAAIDVATSMRMPLQDHVRVAQPEPPFAAKAPKACSLIPAATVKRLGYSGPPETADGYLFGDEEIPSHGCDWTGGLDLQVGAVQNSRVRNGQATASRRYLYLYRSARAWKPDDPEDEKYFHALKGIGDEAFISSHDTSDSATVVFRVRNVLVEVRCYPTYDSDPRPLDDAYTAAVEAAKSVRR